MGRTVRCWTGNLFSTKRWIIGLDTEVDWYSWGLGAAVEWPFNLGITFQVGPFSVMFFLARRWLSVLNDAPAEPWTRERLDVVQEKVLDEAERAAAEEQRDAHLHSPASELELEEVERAVYPPLKETYALWDGNKDAERKE